MARRPELTPAERREILNRRLREEARAASLGTKLEQLASLMASVDEFGWRDALSKDDDRVRALWMKLRAAGARD